MDPCGKGKCTNLIGSYKCECDGGYKLKNDKKSCGGTVFNKVNIISKFF